MYFYILIVIHAYHSLSLAKDSSHKKTVFLTRRTWDQYYQTGAVDIKQI